MNKKDQRVLINNILQNFSSANLDEKSKNISNILFKFLDELKIPNKLIGVYAPMLKEVKWFLTEELDKFEYCFPQMEDGFQVKYYSYPFDDLKSLSFKDEVSQGALEVFPNILIIPGLAFDDCGRRLGRGKGYFDRYLEDKDILKVGICFKEQLLDKVVTSENDINMNYIITENTVKGIK